jgi:putative flippase GtrA
VADPAYPGQVNLVRPLLDRWHKLIRELAKFGIIGIVNTILDTAVFNALFFIGPIKAQVISTVVAATASYFMNRHWTFRHRARSSLRREYTLFFLFNGVGLGITAVILGAATYGLGIGRDERLLLNVVRIVGIVVATVFRFWAYRKWVFLHPEDALYEPEAGVLPEEPEHAEHRIEADHDTGETRAVS